jgi:hypothetical protein
MVCFVRQFDKEEWKSRTKPTEKQLRELRLNGWKSGRGPDFFDWFKTHVRLLDKKINCYYP